MAPKREPEPLPSDDRFGGDYSNANRALVVRSNGARKRSALRYKLEEVPESLLRHKVPEFDRLRREREREMARRRREQQRLHGEGNSSVGVAPAAPPPEGYDPEHFGITLGPEDFHPR